LPHGRLNQKTFERSILHGVTLVGLRRTLVQTVSRMQKPVIDALKKSYHGKAAIRKINIDENRDIALHLGIQSIPTIILFKDEGWTGDHALYRASDERYHLKATH
jgi:thioredoxin 1